MTADPKLTHVNEFVTATVTEPAKPTKRPRLYVWMDTQTDAAQVYTTSFGRTVPDRPGVALPDWLLVTIPGEDEVPHDPSPVRLAELIRQRGDAQERNRDLVGIIATITRERDEARAECVKIARHRDAVATERETLRQQLADERKAARNMLGSLKYASGIFDGQIAAAEARLKNGGVA